MLVLKLISMSGIINSIIALMSNGQPRKDEEAAAAAVCAWLADHGWSVKWNFVQPDPPDLCFLVQREGVKEQKWAVEVTRLFQYVDWKGKEQNSRGLEALIDDLCSRLSAVVPDQAASGYRLCVSGPFDLDFLKIVEQRAIAYVKSGKTDEEYLDFPEGAKEYWALLSNPDCKEIGEQLAQGHCHFSIYACPETKKVQSTTWFHASALTPDGEESAGNIRAVLDYTIRRILDAKVPRLKTLTGYQQKLLVIVQDYIFAEPDRLADILAERKLQPNDVDSILLVDSKLKVHLVADLAKMFEQKV